MYYAKAYSAASATSPLAFTKITRRDPTEHGHCRWKERKSERGSKLFQLRMTV
jgi:hypothetical protein